MCGIIGYIGSRTAPTVLIESLRRLEYRGYDSCGIGILQNGAPKVVRALGGIDNLACKINGDFPPNAGISCGIGHTRWATHGPPSEQNAHPHRDCSGRFIVVHNGIIENYLDLKRKLVAAGHCFQTSTDSEILPHLIESHFKGSLEDAVRDAVKEIEGAYALLAIGGGDGPQLVAARRGAPLVVGCNSGEHFVASDCACLLPYTRQIVYLSDGEVATIRSDRLDLWGPSGWVQRRPHVVTWTTGMAQKNGYAHFMLKEIFEQPRAIRDTLDGRLDRLGNATLEEELPLGKALPAFDHAQIIACGSSLHAAHVGRFAIETVAQLPVQVDYASEFRCREPLVSPRTLLIAISQSGETADTIAAAEEARRRGACVLAISNVEGSSLTRLADWSLTTRAGPEIGVASTKAFTAQLVILQLLALYLSKLRSIACPDNRLRLGGLLRQAPVAVEMALERSHEIAALAQRFSRSESFLYLGRGPCYPIAMEGALKLKEIAYVCAEGLPSGEMKHGPIALIHEGMPAIVIALRDHVYRKSLGNLEEIKGRGATVLAIATEGDSLLGELADEVAFLPSVDSALNPLVAAIPVQLLAYYIAVCRGCNVDRPRNLAKTVTVE